jgi:hypothetical protein
MNFDGIELHPIFLKTLMDFDGKEPIRMAFGIKIINIFCK